MFDDWAEEPEPSLELPEPGKVYSVSALSAILDGIFRVPEFRRLTIEAEVTNISNRKHVYIEVADPDSDNQTGRAVLKLAIWFSKLRTIKQLPKVGDMIRATGSLSYYKGGGSLTFSVDALEIISNEGKKLKAKKDLINELFQKGFLSPERKFTIPRFVHRLAIVSSPEAAGYQDMRNTLDRRYPVEEIQLFPAIVQGDSAPASIAKALRSAYLWKPDVIIIGRGGGSRVDLDAFDAKEVAYALTERNCPVITAIGHTKDKSVADLVADAAAITPTDAANKINPGLDELEDIVSRYRSDLGYHLRYVLNQKFTEVQNMRDRLNAKLPTTMIQNMKTDFNSLRTKFFISVRNALTGEKNRILGIRQLLYKNLRVEMDRAIEEQKHKREILTLRGVEATLKRGYSIVLGPDGKAISSVDQAKIGEKVTLKLSDGRLISQIDDIEKGGK